MQTEEREPGGSAGGRAGYATQQNKHVHLTSATVLCDTVNPNAQVLLRNPPRILIWMRCRAYPASSQLTCLNEV